MIDETQGPGSELPEAGQETSMGGESEWSTVPPSSAPAPPAAPTPALEPLPQPASYAPTSAPTGPPVPPQPSAGPAPVAQQSYQPVYGTGQPPPPPSYASAPGSGYPPPQPPPAAQGLSSNAGAAISYLTFIPAVIFLAMAPYNRDRFVRFHAWQSIALWIALIAVHIVFTVLGVTGVHFLMWGLHMLVDLVLFIFWLIAIIKASQGQWFKIPVVGDLAQSFAGKDA